MRNISDKTVITALVNLKCVGKLGKCVKGFNSKERGYVLDEMERRGWLQPNSIELTEAGNEIVKQNLSLLQH